MDTLTLEKLCRRDSDLSKCFLGVFPSDLLPTDVPRPSCLIANTQPSSNKGEHWVAIFINKEGYGDYFCSYGISPSRFFVDFMDDNTLSWASNEKCIQGNVSTTCGQYAVFFLFCRARGLPMRKFLSLFTSDNGENDSIVTAFINGKFNLSTVVFDSRLFQ